MEHPTDSEKQLLIHSLHCEEEKSSSELSEDVSAEMERRNHEWSRGEIHHQHQNPSWSRAEAQSRRSAKRKLFAACSLTLVFMIAELIGGYWAHSLAIMTDAAHLLTDFGSICISICSLWISSRPPTHTMTFGWYRAEILGMFVSVVSIWALTAILIFSAVERISDGNYDIDSHIMLITSGFAVAINVLMVLILHQPGISHGHSHGSSSKHPQKKQELHRHGNASVRAAFIHVVGDFVQSVGVLVAAVIIHTWPEYKIADPICTFLFSALVVGTTVPITDDILRILMAGSPPGVSFSAVRKSLLSLHGVVDVTNLHMWSLNMSHSLLTAHVATEEAADPQTVLLKATEILSSEFGFTSVTIQVEKRKNPGAEAVETD